MDLNFIQYEMNAFGDYIFLIIIVVASIVQAIVQKNKKEEAAKAERRKSVERELQEEDYPEEFPRQEESGGTFFEQMERMLMPELPTEEKQPELQPEVPKKKEEIVRESSIQNYKMFEGEVHEFQKNLSGTKSQQTKEPIKPRVSRMFNLKKAVIYSEVLNRKYF